MRRPFPDRPSISAHAAAIVPALSYSAEHLPLSGNSFLQPSWKSGVFRLPMTRLAVLFALSLTAAPALAPAQVMPATVVRRGAGAGGLEMSDGEPISFVLEHAQVLDITDSQRIGLMNLRRRLRAANELFMEQLDSLRESMGISLEPRSRGLTNDDRQKLQRFQLVSQPITDSIKVNNDAANLQVRGLLDSVQVVRLDSLVVHERGTIGGRRPPPSGSRSSKPSRQSLLAGRVWAIAAR